jgi:hypothetical protein
MVKDARGVDIQVGDKIVLHPEITPKMLLCTVKHISEGGLAMPAKNIPGVPPGAQVIQGGTMVLIVEINMNFNPTQPIAVFVVEKNLPSSGTA